MKFFPLSPPLLRGLLLSSAVLFVISCATQTEVEIQDNDNAAAFAKVKPVLERNCVHCHAAIRLPGMPSLTDTKALAGLIGPNNLIVPRNPEKSRFYVVVTLADNQAGAMPPTGHAMSTREVATLREWIQRGAALPSETIILKGEGRSPRSR